MGRSDGKNSLFKSLEYAPDYEPNFEFGKKTIGSCGPKFEKLSHRKPLGKRSTSLNESFLDFDRLYSTQRSNFFPV